MKSLKIMKQIKLHKSIFFKCIDFLNVKIN